MSTCDQALGVHVDTMGWAWCTFANFYELLWQTREEWDEIKCDGVLWAQLSLEMFIEAYSFVRP